jgi:hypothetical protein
MNKHPLPIAALAALLNAISPSPDSHGKSADELYQTTHPRYEGLVCDNYQKPSKTAEPAPLTEAGALANEILNFFILNDKVDFIESKKGERLSTFTQKKRKGDKKVDIKRIDFYHPRRYAWAIRIDNYAITDHVIYREFNNIYIHPRFDIKALHNYLADHFKEFPAPSK